MNHSHKAAVRCCHHINFRIYLGKLFFQYHHTEDRRSGRDISRALCHTVCSRHSGACVSFRRGDRCSSLKIAANIQSFSPFFGKEACIFSGKLYLRQNIFQLPAKVFLRDQSVEFFHHRFIVILGLAADGEHTGGVAYADDLLSCHLPVNIARQGCQVCKIFYMRFLV